MNLLNKKNYHRYFGFLKAVLFQTLLILMCSSESYAWVGHENSFTFWEAIYVFGIMFSICIAIFFIFKIIFQFCVYIVRDKLKIRFWYVIVPVLVLPYIYFVAKIVDDMVSFVSKQKKVNPKIIIGVLDLFLFFVSSVISGGILFVLLFTWTSFANSIGF